MMMVSEPALNVAEGIFFALVDRNGVGCWARGDSLSRGGRDDSLSRDGRDDSLSRNGRSGCRGYCWRHDSCRHYWNSTT
jgi:hypothetical protein